MRDSRYVNLSVRVGEPKEQGRNVRHNGSQAMNCTYDYGIIFTEALSVLRGAEMTSQIDGPTSSSMGIKA